MKNTNTLSTERSYYSYIFIAIILLALLIRLVGLNKGIWIDEYYSFRWNPGDSVWQYIIDLRDYDKPPLYFVLLYFWSKISVNEAFSRLLSLLFDIGIVITAMIWIKKYSYLASILAGIYFATTPIFLRYAQEIRPYSLLVFATVLAFFFVSKIISKPEKKSGYIGVALSLAVAVSTHLVAVMLIPPISIFLFLMMTLENRKIHWVKSTLALTIPSLTFCFFYFFYLINLDIDAGNWWMPPISWKLLSSTAQYSLGFSSFYFSSPIDHLIVFIFSAIFAIAFIFGNWKRNFPFLVAAISFWLEIIVYSLINTPIFFYRIILPGMIPFVAFISLQIATIKIKNLKKIAVVLFAILGITFSLNWTFVQAHRPVEYFKQVAHSLDSQWQSNALVMFYPGYISNTVTYHTQKVDDDAAVVVWDTKDIETVRSELSKKIVEMDSDLLDTLFLVARVDLSVDQKGFENVLSAIQSEAQKPLKIKSFLVVGHDFYFVNSEKPDDFLTALDSEFGKPKVYQDNQAYVTSEYMLDR